MSERTVLAEIIRSAEGGVLPPADGKIEVVPAPSSGTAAVVAFTAHAVIAADVDEAWVRQHIPDGDLAAPTNPPFLSALENRLDRRVNAVDIICTATPLAGPPPVELDELTDSNHPRVRRAKQYRDDVRVWSVPDGVLILGRGLAGRWETAVEIAPDARGRGLGRRLATAARHLVPAGRPVWAQVTPGNAASVRAFFHAGFEPVGSEALLIE